MDPNTSDSEIAFSVIKNSNRISIWILNLVALVSRVTSYESLSIKHLFRNLKPLISARFSILKAVRNMIVDTYHYLFKYPIAVYLGARLKCQVWRH